MRNKLILKDADFSANGIYNPNFDWVLNYMEDIETLPVDSALAQSSLGSPAILGLGGKTIKTIVLRIDTTYSARELADEVKLFKYTFDAQQSLTGSSLIGSYIPRRTEGKNDYIFVNLENPVKFTDVDYLVLVGYKNGEVSSSMCCGCANLADGEHRFQTIRNITIVDDVITAGRPDFYNEHAGYCPDIAFSSI